MSITLPAELDRFLQTEVSEGRYASVSDAVCEAVRIMQRQRKIEALRKEIGISEAQMARGEFVDLKDTEELRQFMESLRQQWRQELNAEGNTP